MFLKDHSVSTQLLELLSSDSYLIFSADVFQIPPNPLLQCGLPHLAVWICCRLCKSSPCAFSRMFHCTVSSGSPHCDRAAHTEVWELLDELRIPSDNFLEMLHFILYHWCDEQKFFHQGSWPWGFSKQQWDNWDSSQTSQKGLSKKLSASSFPITFPSYPCFLCNSFLL